jgi:hypothetical protein
MDSAASECVITGRTLTSPANAIHSSSPQRKPANSNVAELKLQPAQLGELGSVDHSRISRLITNHYESNVRRVCNLAVG